MGHFDENGDSPIAVKNKYIFITKYRAPKRRDHFMRLIKIYYESRECWMYYYIGGGWWKMYCTAPENLYKRIIICELLDDGPFLKMKN
jgi:hypothetical protein